MFCKKCGKELLEGARFCAGCGAPTNIEQSAPAPRPAQPIQPAPTQPAQTIQSVNISGISPTDNIKHADAPMKKTGVLYLGHFISLILLIIYIANQICITNQNNLTIERIKLVSSLNIVIYVINILMLILSSLLAFVKGEKNTNYVCPKCKCNTKHNKYNVCESCGYDAKFVAFFSFPTCILSFILEPLIRSLHIFDYFFALIIPTIILAILHLSVLIAPIFYYPTKMARRNEHPATIAIGVLNYMFGATIIFWIILLIWASSYTKPGVMNVQIQQSQPLPQPAAPTLSDKLKEINSLKDQGLISQEEYEAMRSRIFEKA